MSNKRIHIIDDAGSRLIYDDMTFDFQPRSFTLTAGQDGEMIMKVHTRLSAGDFVLKHDVISLMLQMSNRIDVLKQELGKAAAHEMTLRHEKEVLQQKLGILPEGVFSR